MKEEDQRYQESEGSLVRGAYMLLFVIINNIAGSLLYVLILFQFFYKLIKGNVNDRVLSFTGQLNHFIYLTGRFASYQIDEKPFPFAPWPDAEFPIDDVVDTVAPQASATVKETPAKAAQPAKKAAPRKRAPAKPKAPKAPPKDVE